MVSDCQRNSKMKEFECKKCQRRFSLANTLFKHYRMHMKREFACSKCFEEFSTKTLFILHRVSKSLSCQTAKPIAKASINQQRQKQEMEQKLSALLYEFKVQVENRENMVCVCV